MTNLAPIRPRIKPSEEGYMLIAVMFMLAILLVAMSVAVPKIAKQIQRDREVETMHRGKQYIRGIKMYYKKFGAYPPNMDALIQTNQIRFLRKKYIDPTTGKDEWKLIHLGQNQVPTAWGFFGVPLNAAGVGGPCGNGLTGSNPSNSISPPGNSGPTFGSSAGASNCPSDTSSSTTSTNPNPQSPTDPNAANGNPAPGTGTGTGLTGQTFGGGGIIGVSPASPKQAILVLHKKNHYKDWEFVYDPLAEQMMMQGGNTGTGLPTNPNGTNPTGTTGGGGSSIAPGGGSINNPGGGTSNTPTTPQQ